MRCKNRKLSRLLGQHTGGGTEQFEISLGLLVGFNFVVRHVLGGRHVGMSRLMGLCELQLLLWLLMALRLLRLVLVVVRVVVWCSFSCFSLVVDCTGVAMVEEEFV